jgi:uncharacterized protein (TIGR03435 family)
VPTSPTEHFRAPSVIYSMNTIRFGALALLLASGAAAQRPEFEVASVRVSSDTVAQQAAISLHIDGAQVRGRGLTLLDYVSIAYNKKRAQITGPDWIGSDRYDIAATLPSGASSAQIPEMLQVLLESRLQLKLHHDRKDFSVYALAQGKGPLKLKEIAADDDDQSEAKGAVNVSGAGSQNGVNINLGHGSSYSFANNRFEGKKLSMASFADTLERFTDRPVVDETGLKGRYDVAFDLSPEDYQALLIRSAVSAGVVLPPQALRILDTPAGSLPAIVQPLGLKMESRKSPLDIIVIDKVEKTPQAN